MSDTAVHASATHAVEIWDVSNRIASLYHESLL